MPSLCYRLLPTQPRGFSPYLCPCNALACRCAPFVLHALDPQRRVLLGSTRPDPYNSAFRGVGTCRKVLREFRRGMGRGKGGPLGLPLTGRTKLAEPHFWALHVLAGGLYTSEGVLPSSGDRGQSMS
jgi:hypothetical protein